jgi:putative transposase
MRELGLCASVRRRRVVTTDSRHAEPIAPNVLEQDFSAEAPERKWAGDITYIPTDEGWLYLAVFLDLYSRAVIGWSMSASLAGELTRDALSMALTPRQPKGDLLVHSDRGVQYAAGDFRQMLKDWSITPSMSAKGNCYDNAVSESFFATLKKELVHREHYRTHDEARASIFEYIEIYYNRQRRHSTIGYDIPARFEEKWHRQRASTAESATVENPSPQEGFSTGVDGSVATAIHSATSTQRCPL